MNTTTPCAVVALLSGGLDSILAARLMQDLGHSVTCLHFVSPFFGKPHLLSRWERLYNLRIQAVDISEDFARMLVARPEHGFGKVINPCVDCKILMLRKAKSLMESLGAKVIVTGEVLGQRPMSQRRDTLNVIQRDADVRGLLLRPLCAQLLEETPAEAAGLVDRSRLLGFSGRGRKDQKALAAAMGLTELPTPAGGCLLAERENARSYWPVLKYCPNPGAAEFHLANTGRQYWSHVAAPLWLCVGRNNDDNSRLLELAKPTDYIFKVGDFPGPIAVARPLAESSWDAVALRSAAAFMASFSPKALRHAAETGEAVAVRVHQGEKGLDGPGESIRVTPDRATPHQWSESLWLDSKEDLRSEARAKAQEEEKIKAEKTELFLAEKKRRESEPGRQ